MIIADCDTFFNKNFLGAQAFALIVA